MAAMQEPFSSGPQKRLLRSEVLSKSLVELFWISWRSWWS